MRLSVLILLIASLGPFSPTEAASLSCQLKSDHPNADELAAFQECVRKNIEKASGKGTATSLLQTTTPQKTDSTLLQSNFLSTSLVQDAPSTPGGERSNCTVAQVLLTALEVCDNVVQDECDSIMREIDEWLNELESRMDKSRLERRSVGKAELAYLRHYFESFDEQCEFQLWKMQHWENIVRPARSPLGIKRNDVTDRYENMRKTQAYVPANPDRWGRSSESMREKRQVPLQARRLMEEYQKLRESKAYGMQMSRWGRSSGFGNHAPYREKRGLEALKKVDQMQSILEEYLRWREQKSYGKQNARWGRSTDVVEKNHVHQKQDEPQPEKSTQTEQDPQKHTQQRKRRQERSVDAEEFLKVLAEYEKFRQQRQLYRQGNPLLGGSRRYRDGKLRLKRTALPSAEELLEMYRQWRQKNAYGKVNGRWG